MSAIELKRYHIKPDCWPAFIDVWRRIVVVRRRHGFEILFALADRKNDIFTWAIRHDGDFDRAADAYYADPERTDLASVNDLVAEYHIDRVQAVGPDADDTPGQD